MKKHIGVLGPNTTTVEQNMVGREVGRLIAEAQAVLLCGGLGGMMEAAAMGAREAGGLTVGLLPGADRSAANSFIDLAIPTDLGAFRNALLVRSCDAVIALYGAYGTLSEIAFALRLGIPVVGLDTWEVGKEGLTDPGIHSVASPAEAVALALELANKSSNAPD